MPISINALLNKPTMDQKFAIGNREDEQSFTKERDAELHTQLMQRLQEQERLRKEAAVADLKLAEDTGVKDLLASGRAPDLASAQKMYAEMRGAENASNMVSALRSWGASKWAEGTGSMSEQAAGHTAEAAKAQAAVDSTKAREELTSAAMQDRMAARDARMANARATSENSENQRLTALANRPRITDVANASNDADVAIKQLQTAGAKSELADLNDPQLQGWKRAEELNTSRMNAVQAAILQQAVENDPTRQALMTGINKFRAPTLFDLMNQSSPLNLGTGIRGVAAPPMGKPSKYMTWEDLQ